MASARHFFILFYTSLVQVRTCTQGKEHSFCRKDKFCSILPDDVISLCLCPQLLLWGGGILARTVFYIVIAFSGSLSI